ncbi:MAG: uroporphyrinogen decarboxylase [Solirubrobacterales bacterium]|nr:uroporphyrinogen decarboxylase [Solirubrobacterales bacterium]OJU96121.1 MAG: uroporphyrinogen decarboxylase [Solirubrobacterales bacterium 67-14]
MTAGPEENRPTPLLVRALRREPVERKPVWFMRQAGRSLPEYRKVRQGVPMLEMCRTPDLCAEVTLQPVRRHGVDAAILFSDIVTPIEAIGIGVEIQSGVGPVVAEPFRSRADLDRLRSFEPEADLPEVAEAISIITGELGETPLIGFAGAPFTLASYLVEGRPSKSQERARAMQLEEPALFRDLLERLADISIASLRSQVEAGVQAVQVFDSWAGSLSEATYREAVLPVSRRLFTEIESLGVPRIHFAVNAGHLMEAMAEAGPDAMGVDWRTPLSQARRRLGEGFALQGNLDPTVPLAGPEVLERETRALLADAPELGHVFNLGHGVLPSTDPAMLTELVGLVHQITEKAN